MLRLNTLRPGVTVPFLHSTSVRMGLKRPAEQLVELRKGEREPVGFHQCAGCFYFSLFTCGVLWKRIRGSVALPGCAVAGREMSGLNGKISNLRL